MKIEKIAIVGGTGFVGRHLARGLAAHGCQLRILSRYPHRHRDLVTREIDVRAADVNDDGQLRTHFTGMDAVVYLPGILNESGSDGRNSFRHVHVELPRQVAAACQAVGVPRLLHMSALHAGDPEAQSYYLRTKGVGEDAIHSAASDTLAVTSFRPSVIFGPGNNFLNQFAGLLRIAPIFPLPCSDAKLSPIYIGDVTQVFIQALDDPDSFGQRYNLCGPRVYTLRAIIEYIVRLLELKRIILPLEPKYAQLHAKIMEKIPGKPFSMDNYLSLQTASICPAEYVFPFGITPTPMEAIAPYYIGNQGQRRRYTQFRVQAGSATPKTEIG